MKKQEIVSILKSHLKIGGHDAWEGHYYYVEGIEAAACALLAASQSASVAQAPRHPALDWKMQQPECPRCKGNGRIGVMACNDCGATGYTLSSTNHQSLDQLLDGMTDENRHEELPTSPISSTEGK